MKRMIVIVLMAACGSSGGGMNPQGDDGPMPDAPNGSNGSGGIDAPTTSANKTIFTIVLENHDYAEIVASANAPYINSLIAMGALATNYKDTNHPSLPNYLHMISGDDQYPGFIDIGPNQAPYFPAMKDNLGTQLEAAHVPWRSYQESMGSPCVLADSGDYATKHDPFLYFTDMQAQALCAQHNVDYGQFAADLAANTYKYMWITPNLTDDGHNPTTDPVAALRTCDTWLSTEVPKILASDGFRNGGVLFITWDEAEGRNNDDKDKIPMIIVSPRVKQAGMTSATAYTHSSYLATIEDMLSLPRLATVTTAPAMMEFLNP
jgi:phosphatidylinositol-3-phosphatase